MGWTNAAIGRDVGVSRDTIRRWLKDMGIAPKGCEERFVVTRKKSAEKEKAGEEVDQLKEDIEENLENQINSATSDAKLLASLEEDKQMMEIAEAQSTASDKYQGYMAAAAIKLIRDGMRGMQGPKNVRDLDVLDKIARRSLGLNEKGGGSGKMSIDISILNNTDADRGNGAIKKSKTIDAEVVDDTK